MKVELFETKNPYGEVLYGAEIFINGKFFKEIGGFSKKEDVYFAIEQDDEIMQLKSNL